MLISPQKKFLFIHIQRTAGTSIHRRLSQQVPDVRPFLGTHDHARWAKQQLGAAWDQYWTFAFVRNPWERLVSWYSLITRARSSWYGRLMRRRPNRLWEYVQQNATSFEEFVYRCTETIDDIDGRKSFVYNQLDYITDEQGGLIVDFVGRYECLHADLAVVWATLGLAPPILSRANRSRRPHYSTFYTATTQQLIRERYARDIAFFGYTFEERS